MKLHTQLRREIICHLFSLAELYLEDIEWAAVSEHGYDEGDGFSDQGGSGAEVREQSDGSYEAERKQSDESHEAEEKQSTECHAAGQTQSAVCENPDASWYGQICGRDGAAQGSQTTKA